HMRHDHISNGWWTMPGAPDADWPGTKSGREHRVWLPQPARDIISMMEANRHHGVDFIFTADGRRAISNLDGAMREVCKALNAQRLTPHNLRRTHGTMVTRLGSAGRR